jgi:hypothetical protein
MFLLPMELLGHQQHQRAAQLLTSKHSPPLEHGLNLLALPLCVYALGVAVVAVAVDKWTLVVIGGEVVRQVVVLEPA